jgi:cell filamentation protein, protein adenylyltransferase
VTADHRYDVSALPEAQFEPGSNQVLRNRLGITSRQEMDDAEAKALEKTLESLLRKYSETHRFTAADIRECHYTWLGDIYEWAGQYRQVNLSKDAFPLQLPRKFLH